MSDVANTLSEISKVAQGAVALVQQLQNSARIMYMLGPFMFSRDTASPQSIERTSEYSWTQQSRLGRDSASQFTGITNDTFDIEGVIYPEYKGGIEQITLMRILAEQGEPLMFVSGTGVVHGNYCILSVEETAQHLAPNGSPRKLEFTLSLQKYGADDEDGLLGSLF